MKTENKTRRQNDKLASRRHFKRKLSRYRHTRSYNRISGGFSGMVSFSQSRNRKLLIGLVLIILAIGFSSFFLHW